MLLVTYLKLMRMFRSDAANGVHNFINLSVIAGERMGQRDVRKGVVSAVPADLKLIWSMKILIVFVNLSMKTMHTCVRLASQYVWSCLSKSPEGHR